MMKGESDMLRTSGLVGISLVLLVGAPACGENPRQEGSSRGSSIALSDSSSIAEHAASRVEGGNKSDSVRVSIQLRDGSNILGYPLLDTLTLQTQYAALRLAFRLVRTLEFSADRHVTAASLVTGERLQGNLAPSMIPLRTLVGNLSVPIRDVASILVSNGSSFLDSGLVAYYPFDGDANDKSGHGHNGTVNGAVLSSDQAGKPNSAYSFDGNESYIAIPDGIVRYDVHSFSISAWLFSSDNNSRRIAIYLGATEGEVEVDITDQKITFNVNIDGVWHTASTDTFTDKWFHVVAIYRRGESCQLWVNGFEKSQAAIPSGDLFRTHASHHSTIGSYAPAYPDHARTYGLGRWHGTIDQVRIYNRSLEPDEIKMLFALGE